MWNERVVDLGKVSFFSYKMVVWLSGLYDELAWAL